MKLYIYHGLANEIVPRDVTHVIVDNSVTIIKNGAFSNCNHLVSVIMGDNVKRIGVAAFCRCYALRFIRLSKTLEYIGELAFKDCCSLEALFLPSTIKSIRDWAFWSCQSLRLLILPNGIDLSNAGDAIIDETNIEQIAVNAGVAYEGDHFGSVTEECCRRLNECFFRRIDVFESNRRVNEWLFHHMDTSPFHKLLYNPSITTKQINDYLDDNGNDAAASIDPCYNMTPLHMLSMNPHAPADTIAALLDVNMEVAFCLDNQGKLSLDYARDYNVGGLVSLINGICNHRHAA